MADILVGIVIYVLLLPITVVLATPIILIISFFGKESYVKNLKKYYKGAFKFWLKIIDTTSAI